MKNKIKIIDGYSPEETAMLQSLLSRSNKDIDKHIEEKVYKKSGEFIKKWYIEGNHKSIGDCGTITIWFNDISMLAAKAIQDNPLYNGLERSTRYQDFSNDSFVDPFNTKESKEIQQNWFNFYRSNKDIVYDHLLKTYPKPKDEHQKKYEDRIRSRTFDVMRGFLPCGTKTSLSWHTNLRQARDNIERLSAHPLCEVNDIAYTLLKNLRSNYPNSFLNNSNKKDDNILLESTYRYNYSFFENYFFFINLWEKELYKKYCNNHNVYSTYHHFDLQNFQDYDIYIQERPEGVQLSNKLMSYGNIEFRFFIDFGCFRDIQRHRSCFHPIPLIYNKFGYEKWYLDMLPDNIRSEAIELINKQSNSIKLLYDKKLKDLENIAYMQYYHPMCVNVPVYLSGSIDKLIYLIETRSKQAVHPVLRKISQNLAFDLEKNISFIKLYVDKNNSEYSIW